ncbi:WXG100 family type VII secretion target [Rathayibacter caricis]|uniref:WXG100 family type VII secretion target n=1 Tax=Rathayibacter caricis TaxID=110936 RepID=UPI001FB2C488|nr:WXG100 family type VII secretion target [Rathayibacter caricis]MCJ1696299.1 WXG100 family type VII secretion target [Rathayibacter caricis]
MAVWGLDVEQVRTLSSKLNQEASTIQQVLSTLTSQLGNTQWSGPDAEQFRNDWSSTHTAALNRVINALQDASQRASQNAAQQESASS